MAVYEYYYFMIKMFLRYFWDVYVLHLLQHPALYCMCSSAYGYFIVLSAYWHDIYCLTMAQTMALGLLVWHEDMKSLPANGSTAFFCYWLQGSSVVPYMYSWSGTYT